MMKNMPKFSRRGFFGAAAVAPVVAKSVAKEAIEKAAANVAMPAGEIATASATLAPSYRIRTPLMSLARRGLEVDDIKFIGWLCKNGRRDDAIAHAKMIANEWGTWHTIDVSLLPMRSMSTAAKLTASQDRLVKYIVENYEMVIRHIETAEQTLNDRRKWRLHNETF